MRTAKHKMSRARLEGRTTLPPEDLYSVATQVAEATTVDSWQLSKRVRVQPIDRDAAGQHFDIGVPQRSTILVFCLQAIPDGDRTGVRTEIEEFQTTQSMVAGFIPAGPKSLAGYPWYSQFLLNLRTAILAVDATAELAIIERDGA